MSFGVPGLTKAGLKALQRMTFNGPCRADLCGNLPVVRRLAKLGWCEYYEQQMVGRRTKCKLTMAGVVVREKALAWLENEKGRELVMAMRRCGACGKEFRRGRIVMLLGPGGLQGRTVCMPCADDGVVIVAPKLAPVIDTTKAQKKELRDVLQPFIDNIQAKIAGIQVVPKEMRDEFQDGRYEAYAGILGMLKEGRP